jgi:hypothetical protein
LLTGLFRFLLPLHLIGRSAGAGSPMAKSWLVRALVPGHLHVQGPRLLAMARHLAGSLRTRHYDCRMDDLRRSARRNPRTPSTSRLGRTASIIVSLYRFLSWFYAVILPDLLCFPIRCLLSPGSSPTTCIIIPSSRDPINNYAPYVLSSEGRDPSVLTYYCHMLRNNFLRINL